MSPASSQHIGLCSSYLCMKSGHHSLPDRYASAQDTVLSRSPPHTHFHRYGRQLPDASPALKRDPGLDGLVAFSEPAVRKNHCGLWRQMATISGSLFFGN